MDLNSGPFLLHRLRFHVDRDAANFLLELEGTDLDSHDQHCLKSFLNLLGETEDVNRRHVFLGQLFVKDKLCIQGDPVFIIAEKTFDGEIQATLAQVQRMVAPRLESFEESHDLEDDDHDGGDNEEKRRSWGNDDIDEPNF